MEKEVILEEFDRLLKSGEKVTYRKMAENLGTVASTITYQFGSKDDLMSEYINYKFTEEYKVNLTSFTDLLIFSSSNNRKILELVGDDISLSALKKIHDKLLLLHYDNYTKLYVAEYGEENKVDMVSKLTFVHMLALTPNYYEQVFDIDINNEEDIKKLISEL